MSKHADLASGAAIRIMLCGLQYSKRMLIGKNAPDTGIVSFAP
jgi:hypothetical protein